MPAAWFQSRVSVIHCVSWVEIPYLLIGVIVKIPDQSLLHPSDTAAVCAGNVLTSQRIVDVVLKAFHACAASQGCCKCVVPLVP